MISPANMLSRRCSVVSQTRHLQWFLHQRTLCSVASSPLRQQHDIASTPIDGFFKNQNHQQVKSRLYHTSSLCPHVSTAAAAAVNVTKSSNSELPSNLTFDFKSSFAPKQEIQKKQGILVEPKDGDDKNQAGDGEGVRDNEDYDDVDELLESWTSSNRNLRKVIPLPDRLRQDVHHGPDGSVSGSIWLNKSVFGVDPIRLDLIKQSVDYIRAKIRGRRKAKTKTISEKSGSGRKVRQQKGTGRARAGHSRPAHWRGGAKAHGPKNTVDYGNIKMNAKQKKLAIRSVLSQKCLEGNLIVIDHLRLPSHKTNEWARLLEDKFGIGGKSNYRAGNAAAAGEFGGSTALILDHYYETEEEGQSGGGGDSTLFHASYHGVPINLWVASSNLHKIKVANQRFANVYDILKREKLVVTLSALEQMENRWKDF